MADLQVKDFDAVIRSLDNAGRDTSILQTWKKNRGTDSAITEEEIQTMANGSQDYEPGSAAETARTVLHQLAHSFGGHSAMRQHDGRIRYIGPEGLAEETRQTFAALSLRREDRTADEELAHAGRVLSGTLGPEIPSDIGKPLHLNKRASVR